MTDLTTIIVADDHPLFRAGVVQKLNECSWFSVVAECDNSAEAVKLVRKYQPNVALLDISMPGGGIDAAKKIAELGNQTKIVMLTVSEDDDDILSSLKVGAVGYILKGIGGSDLVEILSDIAAGNTYVQPALAGRILLTMSDPSRREKSNDEKLASLSKRETDILSWFPEE